MTTNREWLYALDVADLTDWFDAEHVDDDGVSRSNDGVAAEHETDNTCNKSGENVADSRTQIVADINAWLSGNVGISVWLTDVVEQVHGWLDRQAAITEREYMERSGISELQARVDELREAFDEVCKSANVPTDWKPIFSAGAVTGTIEGTQKLLKELTAERDALAADLKECMEQNDKLSDERERWRGTCGMMTDAAHEIERILAEMEAK